MTAKILKGCMQVGVHNNFDHSEQKTNAKNVNAEDMMSIPTVKNWTKSPVVTMAPRVAVAA